MSLFNYTGLVLSEVLMVNLRSRVLQQWQKSKTCFWLQALRTFNSKLAFSSDQQTFMPLLIMKLFFRIFHTHRFSFLVMLSISCFVQCSIVSWLRACTWPIFSACCRPCLEQSTAASHIRAVTVSLLHSLLTPPTRTRQDNTVLSCPCRRCEHNCRQFD